MPQAFAIALIIFVGAFVSACMTQAQRNAEQISGNLQTAYAEVAECRRAASNHADLSILSKRLPLEGNPTLAQLSEKSFVNSAEREAILKLNARMQPCRKMALQAARNTLPLTAASVAQAQAKKAEVYVALINKKITWGEGVQRLVEITNAGQAEYTRIATMYQQNLEQAHQQELQQRQAATQAFQQSVYQQQVLNSLNRSKTTTTNCDYIGNSISCTSR